MTPQQKKIIQQTVDISWIIQIYDRLLECHNIYDFLLNDQKIVK